MYADFQNHLFDAIDAVLACEIPQESFTQAVQAYACLMAGGSLDDLDPSFI